MSGPSDSPNKRTAPPTGSVWDAPLHETSFAFVDLEMTGLDAANDRVLEICIERVRGETLESKISTLVHPGDVTQLGTAIHGISSDDLVGAAPFCDISAAVEEILDGTIFVAHAAKWDVAFLESEMSRANISFAVPHFLDTLALSRKIFATTSHALPALATFLGLPVGRLHRAEEDVRLLRAVFSRCVAEVMPRTARDLWVASRGRAAVSSDVFNACTHALESKTPLAVAYRARGKPKEDFLFVVTDILEDTVKGYDVVSRSRRELAISRILAAHVSGVKTP